MSSPPGVLCSSPGPHARSGIISSNGRDGGHGDGALGIHRKCIDPAGTSFLINLDHFQNSDILESEGLESVVNVSLSERRLSKNAQN